MIALHQPVGIVGAMKIKQLGHDMPIPRAAGEKHGQDGSETHEAFGGGIDVSAADDMAQRIRAGDARTNPGACFPFTQCSEAILVSVMHRDHTLR